MPTQQKLQTALYIKVQNSHYTFSKKLIVIFGVHHLFLRYRNFELRCFYRRLHSLHLVLAPTTKIKILFLFSEFQKMIENEFSRTLTFFQFKGGSEFSSSEFVHHLELYGIIHQFIWIKLCRWAKTSSHSWKGLIMLFHAHIPHYLCGRFCYRYAFNYRMPAPVSKNKLPIQCLFHLPPDNNFSNIFGCLCFPFIETKTMTKFQPKLIHVSLLGIVLNSKDTGAFTYLVAVYFFLPMLFLTSLFTLLLHLQSNRMLLLQQFLFQVYILNHLILLLQIKLLTLCQPQVLPL